MDSNYKALPRKDVDLLLRFNTNLNALRLSENKNVSKEAEKTDQLLLKNKAIR